jgi:hypothetical protein
MLTWLKIAWWTFCDLLTGKVDLKPQPQQRQNWREYKNKFAEEMNKEAQAFVESFSK